MSRSKRKQTIKVKAVLFDMDGVITDTMPIHYLAWKKVLRAEGIPVKKIDVYLREGQRGLRSVNEICKKYKIKIKKNKAIALLDLKEELFVKLVKQKFVSGARRFIIDLHRRGFLLALVTGTSYDELLKILPNKYCLLFNGIVTGDVVRRGKPHPEPYKKALAKLKIKAAQAVVIGSRAPYENSSSNPYYISCTNRGR